MRPQLITLDMGKVSYVLIGVQVRGKVLQKWSLALERHRGLDPLGPEYQGCYKDRMTTRNN